MTVRAILTTGLVAAVALLVASGGPAQAKEGRAAIVQKLADCRKLTDSTARLACYDQTAAAFDQAEAKGDVIVMDREQARDVRKQAFGFTIPSISIFAKGASEEDLASADGVLSTARRNSAGHYVFKLEDGAVWEQVGVEEMFKTPKAGMKVRVRKGTLGSYLMVIEGAGSFKAHRLE